MWILQNQDRERLEQIRPPGAASQVFPWKDLDGWMWKRCWLEIRDVPLIPVVCVQTCAIYIYCDLLWRCIEDIGRFIQIQKQWNATYTAYTIRRMCMIFTSSVTKPLWTMHIIPYWFGPGESCTPPDAALTCADRAGEAENWKRNEFKLKHQLLHVSPWGSHLSCSQCQPHWFYLGSVQLVYICLHDVWEFHGVSRVSVKECWDSNPPFEFEHRRNTYTKSYKNQNSQQLSLRSWSPVATRKSGDQRFAIGWLPHGCSLARSGMEEIHRTSQYPNIFQQYGGTLRHTQILAWWSMILCTGLLQTLLPLTQFFFWDGSERYFEHLTRNLSVFVFAMVWRHVLFSCHTVWSNAGKWWFGIDVYIYIYRWATGQPVQRYQTATVPFLVFADVSFQRASTFAHRRWNNGSAQPQTFYHCSSNLSSDSLL